ncbi:hypothetical protein HPB48_009778 [Haemaphysalis longicornis]|uniref:protein-serine/threonine phosphatase n=1 Tax=Haemaphysalis longicornis TaxID=44386 RepID=A0A9J6GCM5_HAELO|nr:hypothetical protein HPB48_009778 [Haemaphysalis longicornis]
MAAIPTTTARKCVPTARPPESAANRCFEFKSLCFKARELLALEANLQTLQSPVTMRGQFSDLMELVKVGGGGPGMNHAFPGDPVDRGLHSVESSLLLLALKVRYPTGVTLLKGDHESRHITQVFGFYDEFFRKHRPPTVLRYCTDVFGFLPISALVHAMVLSVLGGLSPSIQTLDRIRPVEPILKVSSTGPTCHPLWTYSEEIGGWNASRRGAGCVLASEDLSEFTCINNLDLICRVHRLPKAGSQWHFEKSLVTVFSGPVYLCVCFCIDAIFELNVNQTSSTTTTTRPHSIRSGNPVKTKTKTRIRMLLYLNW